jgi:uncharacterized protein YkwD
MRSSVIISSLFAALAVATPVHKALHKKAYVYDVVTDIVTVTVTAGDLPETIKVQKTVYVNPVAATTSKAKPTPKSRRPRPTTTSIAPPPPPPAPTTTTTTTTPPPPPPPPSTTTEAPAPVYTPEPVPEPEPVVVTPTQAKYVAPVVESSPAPPPSSAAGQSSSGDGVKDFALNYHNKVRAIHHVGSVSWDDALAADAEKLARSCTNKHDLFGGSYGQNIAASADSRENAYTLEEAMKKGAEGWYNEVELMGGNFGSATISDSRVLHFTQVVWKGTTKIGCAAHYCGTQGNIFPPPFYSYFVVCNYAEAGNMGGSYAANVFAA